MRAHVWKDLYVKKYGGQLPSYKFKFKFHADLSFGCVDIGKIKLTFCNQYFSMYFYNIYQNATFLGCLLIFFKGS